MPTDPAVPTNCISGTTLRRFIRTCCAWAWKLPTSIIHLGNYIKMRVLHSLD